MNHFLNRNYVFFLSTLLLSLQLIGCTAKANADAPFDKYNPEKKIIFTPNKLSICESIHPLLSGPFIPPTSEYILNNNTDSINPPSTTHIYNTIEVPTDEQNDLGVWISIVISILAFISSIVIPLYLRHREKRDSINDEFWMREVILPKINELLFSFCESLKNSITSCDGNPAQFQIYFAGSYLSEQGSLRDSFSMLSSIVQNTSLPEELEYICDDLDQNISDNLNSALHIRKQNIYLFQQEIIKKLIECQKLA